MTNSLQDIPEADVIFIIGSNTTEAHPIVALQIKKAIWENGTKIIVADPREIEFAKIADIWLRQKPGSDVALLNAIMSVIMEEGLADMEFINNRTEDFSKLKAILAKYKPEDVEDITGISADEIRKAARLYAQAGAASIIYAMGITQHAHGTDNVLSTANLAMITGNIGRPGTGVNPLRGQNNVQGACDMGCLPNVLPGYQSLDDRNAIQKFSRLWDSKIPDKPGMTVVEMVEAAKKGKLKAMYIMGENVLLSDPDINKVKKALEKLDFLVVQDIFKNETAEVADVILPAASFAEKEGTFTNTERRVQKLKKAVEPPGESKIDWKIIQELAEKMGYEMDYSSDKHIMYEIANSTPICAGILHERLGDEGIAWPCTHREHEGTQILHADEFSRGKGKFHAVEYIPPAEIPNKEFPYTLITGRVLYQFHTRTMTGRSSGVDEIYPEALVEINSKDAKKLKIKDGEVVWVKSRRGKIKLKASVNGKVMEGTVFIPFHFLESPANALTNTALDPVAKIPELKVCAVRIEKIKK